MATPRSGLKPPSRISKSGGIPRPGSLNSQTVKVEASLLHATRIKDAVAQSARVVGMKPSEASHYADNLVKVAPPTNSSNSSTPKDNFIIGERVIVSGNKRGYIQYLGETQFAPNQWAGVVLDEAVGKNDGSVNGVHYFQCGPKRGVFARPDKLSRESAAGSANLASAVAGQGLARPTGLPSAPRMGTRVASPRGSVAKLPPTIGKPSSLVIEETDNANTGLKGGDRVMVSGTKLGTLRYIGTTEFAKGDWAGVDLDEELGKNDGAVAGTRYFQCNPKHGLFAPIHKVAKVRGKPPPRPAEEAVTREKRSSSTSSLSSMGSTASSFSRNMGHGGSGADPGSPRTQEAGRRISAGGPQPEKRNGFGFRADNAHMHGLADETHNESSLVATVMQPLLQESPAHSRLHQKRDSDSGLSRESLELSHHAEHELAVIKAQHEQYVLESEENLDSLRALVESADREKVELLQQLEEERRKLEDFQFRLEEANINSTDLKAEQKEETARVRTLKERLVEENHRASKFQQEVDVLQGHFEEKDFKIAELEAESATYQEQIDFLQKENQNALGLVAKQEYNKLVQNQREGMLTQRDLEIASMQDKMSGMTKEKKAQEEELAQLKEHIRDGLSKQQQSFKTIEELTNQLADKESSLQELAASVQELKNTCADLERKCVASVDRCAQLVEDKQKLEADIAQIMKSSGDSSEQLVNLNEQLRTKERRVEELMAELSEANQSVAKLRETVSQSAETAQRDAMMTAERHRQEVEKCRLEIHSLQASVEVAQTKLSQSQEAHATEVESLSTSYNSKLAEVKGVAEKKKAEFERLGEEANKLRNSLREAERKVETITTDKAQVESSLEQTSKDRDTVKEELDQSLAEKQQLLLAKAELSLRHDESSGKHKQLQDQLDKEGQTTMELQQSLEDSKAFSGRLTQERDSALRERIEALAQCQELTIKLESKTTEVAEVAKRKGAELQRLEEESKTVEENSRQLRIQLEAANQSLEAITSQRSQLETDKSELRKQLEAARTDSDGFNEQTSKELEELRASLVTLKREKDALSREKQSAVQDREALLKDREALQQTREALQQTQEALQQTQEALQQTQEALRQEQETVGKERESAVVERDAVLKEKAAAEERNSTLVQEQEAVLLAKTTAESQAQDLEQQRAEVQGEVEGLKRQVDTYKQQLESLTQATEEGQSTVGSLQAQLAEARCESDARQHQADQSQAEAARLKTKLESLQEERQAKQQLDAEHTKVQKELQELREKLETESMGYKAERDSIQNTLDVTNTLVTEKEREIDKQKQEITSFKGELTLLGSYKNAVEHLENEKTRLEENNGDLQVALQQAQQQAVHASQHTNRDVDVDGDPILAKLQEDREMAEGQVTFLNSVIVDLQRKNDELRARLEIMEEGGINGAHNDLSMDDMDLELSTRMPPPRLFCDICDVFDLHDTEDCPLQSSSDSPPPSQFHGARLGDRAYCDICEVFGHWTENCDDEQTY